MNINKSAPPNNVVTRREKSFDKAKTAVKSTDNKLAQANKETQSKLSVKADSVKISNREAMNAEIKKEISRVQENSNQNKQTEIKKSKNSSDINIVA